MTQIIQQFTQKAQSLGNRNLFNSGASEEKIDAFESKFGFALPTLVAEFYRHFDGGCFADTSWNEEELTDPDERNSILWNSNSFLTLDQIIDFEFFDSQEVFNDEGRWFFPIIHTKGQESLVMDKDKTEVLDAFHEYLPEDWPPLYSSFEALLKAYIETEGDINIIV